jgi:hypothetical protein
MRATFFVIVVFAKANEPTVVGIPIGETVLKQSYVFSSALCIILEVAYLDDDRDTM